MDSVRSRFLSASSSNGSPYLSQWTRRECKTFEQAITRVDRLSLTLFEQIQLQLPRKSVTQVAYRYFDLVGRPRSNYPQSYSSLKHGESKEIISLSSDSEIDEKPKRRRAIRNRKSSQRQVKHKEVQNHQVSKRGCDEVEVVNEVNIISPDLEKAHESTDQMEVANVGEFSMVPEKAPIPSKYMHGSDHDEVVVFSPNLEKVDQTPHHMEGYNSGGCSMYPANAPSSSTHIQGLNHDGVDEVVVILRELPNADQPPNHMENVGDCCMYPEKTPSSSIDMQGLNLDEVVAAPPELGKADQPPNHMENVNLGDCCIYPEKTQSSSRSMQGLNHDEVDGVVVSLELAKADQPPNHMGNVNVGDCCMHPEKTPSSSTDLQVLNHDEVDGVVVSLELAKADKPPNHMGNVNVGDCCMHPEKTLSSSTYLQGLNHDEVDGVVDSLELAKADQPPNHMGNVNVGDCCMHPEKTLSSSTNLQGMFIEVPIDESDDCLILEPLHGQRSPEAKLLKWEDLYPRRASRALPFSTSSQSPIVVKLEPEDSDVGGSSLPLRPPMIVEKSSAQPSSSRVEQRKRGRQSNSDILPLSSNGVPQKVRRQRKKNVPFSDTPPMVTIPDTETPRQQSLDSVSENAIQHPMQSTAPSVKTEPQYLGSVSEVAIPRSFQRASSRLVQQNVSAGMHNFRHGSSVPLRPVKAEPGVLLPYNQQNSMGTSASFRLSSQRQSSVKFEPPSPSRLVSRTPSVSRNIMPGIKHEYPEFPAATPIQDRWDNIEYQNRWWSRGDQLLSNANLRNLQRPSSSSIRSTVHDQSQSDTGLRLNQSAYVPQAPEPSHQQHPWPMVSQGLVSGYDQFGTMAQSSFTPPWMTNQSLLQGSGSQQMFLHRSPIQDNFGIMNGGTTINYQHQALNGNVRYDSQVNPSASDFMLTRD